MRKGFIKISNQLYTERYELICGIFLVFRPTHIEFRHWENSTWYIWGESNCFDELKKGDTIPQYEALVTPHTGAITFNRLK